MSGEMTPAAARRAAYRARELAGFLDDYADHLDAPDYEAEVLELSAFIESKMWKLRAALSGGEDPRHTAAKKGGKK